MKLSKKKEKELMQVYEAYWAEYLNGNVDAMQALLDDSYTQVGSAESEVFSSKKEAVQFLVDTIDQVAGKLEMRNRSTKLEQQQDHLILIHEVCDLYALADKKWIFYSKFRASTLLQEKKEGWKITHQHSSFPDTKTEAGQNVAIEKIAEENKELREAVKRRTVELEEKNRELQIEAALERVRARAMAMQKSEELADLSFELVKQVQALDVPTWFCAFNIYDNDPKGSIEWGSNGEGVFPNYRTPREGIFLRYYKAGQRGESLLINEIGEKKCPGHYEYLCSLPGVGEQLLKMKEAGIPFPTSQIDHVAFFKYGYILFITFEPTPESHEVFKRFAKVFEQTYSRFLDLQKAEAQTREARIEAALERVRARAMAMHKSEELAEAAELLYLQLKDLGINPWTCGYVFLDEKNNEARVWMVQPNGKFFWGFWTVPMSEEKVLKERHESWKKKENLHRKLLKGQENIDHHRYIVEHSPIPPDEAKDFLSTLPIDLMLTSLHFSHGYLMVISESFLSKEEENVLLRFTQVFELTYTRFLDLQKAETQAREAQIEAALERVRSRSIAMHKSEELKEVIQVVYDQFILLSINIEHTGFIIDYKENDDMHIWLADKNEVATEVIIPYFDCAHWNSFNDAKKNGKNFFANHLTFEEKNKFYKDLFKQTPDLPKSLLEIYLNYPGLAISTVLLENVALYIENFDGIPYSDEENDTLMRFGKVFQQTYTRFLDLQKAEAQTRESQIEAAMERIRSRAIAMRTSNELLEVAREIRIQTDLLGQQDLELSVVHLYEKDAEYFESLAAMRTPGSEGKITTHKMKFPVDATPEIQQMMKNYWAGLSQYTIELNLKQREVWQKVLETTVPELFDQRLQFGEDEIIAKKKEYWNFTDFSGGSLLTVTYSPPTKETKELFRRAADVFDLAYKRFNDLKNAEKQAREAQIEAALERVRSRTMAMHQSPELQDVVSLMYNEMESLGLAKWGCAIMFFHEDNAQIEYWLAEETDSNHLTNYFVKGKKNKVYRKLWSFWKDQGATLTLHHQDTYKRKFDEYWLNETDFKNLPNKIKKSVLEKSEVFLNFASMRYGLLNATSYEKIPDELLDVLTRFAKVFEQTYTRFLDIQKAEAQARESQIEMALERVRTASMTMQKGDDLAHVVSVVFTQLKILGVDSKGCGLNLYDENDGMAMWMSGFGEDLHPKSFHISFFDHPYYHQQLNAWKNQEKYYMLVFEGELKKSYDEQTFSSQDFFEIPKDIKEVFLASDKAISCTANMKYGMLEAIGDEALSEGQADILCRFAKVFELAYTRFLDIKKAEAQAREAQIEGALERVRSKTMAMHNSEDLEDIVVSLFDEVLKLGLDKSIRCGIGILEGHEGMETRSVNSKSDGTLELRVGMLNMTIHPMLVGLKKAWKKGSKGYSYEYTEKDVRKYYEALNNEPEYPFNANLETLPEQEFHRSFFFSSGIIFTFSEAPISEESSIVFARFAAVFGQTYRRFLDLQKAEAQAKEAQIEAALERVRSRSMAMHESKEMLAVIAVVSEQLQQLNLNFDTVSFAKNNQEGDFTFWITSRGQPKPILMEVPTLDSPVLKGIYKAQKKGIKFLVDVFPADVNREWHEHLIKYSDLKLFPDKIKDFILNAPGFARSSFLLKNIDLYVGNYRAIPFTDEENSIFRRFAHVFEQSYTRFLDLQKAEAQAKEAQIEAALEKVRSRTMAMHKSEELAETALVLYEQFSVLGNIPDRMSIGIFKEETKEIELWPTDQSGSQLNQKFTGSFEKSAEYTKIYEAWKAGNDSFVLDLSGQKLKTWLKFIREELKLFVDDSHIKGRRVQQAAFFSHGMLLFTTNEPVVDEIMQLLIRFAGVFSQTYTRFLDLQKAEAQTREAQIENTLEKVRSRTMAMQKSEELPEAANNLFLQVQALGIPAWSAGYCIWESEDKETASCNMSSEGEIQKSFILPTIGEGYNFYDPLQKGENFYVEELGGDALVKHYDFMRTLPTVGQILDELIAAGISLPTFQIFHIVYFPQGYLMFITYEQVPDAHEIFKRFARVFEQTYTRFLDLKQAEAQAREATKQASLDRVRGQIASMRTTEDLQRITPLVFNELTTLGVPFFRCGVFIIHEKEKKLEVYLSAPDGHSLGVLHLPFNVNSLTQNSVENWQKNKVYHQHWNKEDFVEWTQSMLARGQIQDAATYQGAVAPPDSLDLHFIPFTQGMLYVGNTDQLQEDDIDLVRSLAEAFSIAYARYEDFTKLEKAKESVETTLTELKATQNQLVQSEKMASLGELTAGIAHEIQNPLNFVNNFSEVSKELLEEMMEEMQKGDVEEVKALADDIIQNLEKIHHHGQRADGIVKGMLQHSRTSSGEKEPTDINELADEYLRLAYHGLRARDKTFNATMKTDYDKSLEKVNVIPQDIGRAMLNLITNAFYVVDEKKKQLQEGYEPKISVSTKKINGKVEIKVTDNGNGIPKKVLDKIFQPFFTTKPTGQGTGLGLSLSYDIVKAHGGELTVETKKNEGSAFNIYLPL